jgi:hypothetical protein
MSFPQPSSCPVCRMANKPRHGTPFTTMMRDTDDPTLMRVNYQCGFCHSIFWWNPETEEACGKESRYPLTRAGWNTSVVHIRRRYLKGDVCPRCKADPSHREPPPFRPGPCVICHGTGVYPGDD